MFSNFSTCEISDALVKLGIPHGGHLPDIHMISPVPLTGQPSVRICGPAYTVKMVFATDTSEPKLKEHFVDTVPPGSVIVISAPYGAKNAVWGGLMTAGAQARQAIGVVVSGRCRDISEHRAANFPVFARSHSTLGQSSFTRPSAVNVPLAIVTPGTESNGGGVDRYSSYVFPPVYIRSGDWMVADEDGVVCIPRELQERVAELAEKGREIDARCQEDIKAGKAVQATFNTHRMKSC
jgi:regulator of RNase E activity RraA